MGALPENAVDLEDKENTVIYMRTEKISCLLTNPSSLCQLEGAVLLISNPSVGVPQPAGVALVSSPGSSGTVLTGTGMRGPTLPAKWLV